jgi:signal transduction histidine kinase
MTIALNHEINNPLTAILGLAQIAQESYDLNETTRRAMARIEAQALRIADVTRRLRQLETIHLTEYLKDGPLMLDLKAGAGVAPVGDGARADRPALPFVAPGAKTGTGIA